MRLLFNMILIIVSVCLIIINYNVIDNECIINTKSLRFRDNLKMLFTEIFREILSREVFPLCFADYRPVFEKVKYFEISKK